MAPSEPPASTPAGPIARDERGCIDRDATVVRAATPTYPANLEAFNAESYTLIELHADGSIASTSTYRTSQNSQLDDAADEAANKSMFRAAIKNCVQYSSSVVVRTPFVGGTMTLTPATPACAETGALLASLARPANRSTAQRGKRSGTATVDVSVEADGTVSDAQLIEQSGSTQIDAEALRIAKQSKYYAGRSGCNAIPASVKLELSFL